MSRIYHNLSAISTQYSDRLSILIKSDRLSKEQTKQRSPLHPYNQRSPLQSQQTAIAPLRINQTAIAYPFP
ncbi:hypothetical protein [Pseudanabaena sp. BC1403]|uniref:hypothetical protein n=1 Tax=Pseudanabaena sp. BC1403 TaxID=2043171 RepID=UPI000CD97CFC|nr:hypothetical protein [Pseudanabaena sp. BC1403]